MATPSSLTCAARSAGAASTWGTSNRSTCHEIDVELVDLAAALDILSTELNEHLNRGRPTPS
ncbi:protein of unknown function [Agreia sp. COWG]|nr:protein of unknown function [Agreia sp. COWG]